MNLLTVVDSASLALVLMFIVLAVLIRRKINLPQNSVLMIVGITIFIHLTVHIPEYFSFLPALSEETEHVISDLTEMVSVLILFWYGVMMYQHVRKVVS